MTTKFTSDTEVTQVINDPAFKGFGRLLFPLDSYFWSGNTLGNLRFIYYSHMDSNMTVDILNTLKERSEKGEKIFFDIYSEEEKKRNPQFKRNRIILFQREKR